MSARDRARARTPNGYVRELAAALGLSERNVHGIASIAGGGFGGKHTVGATNEAARLARAAGRPVKITWTREEEFSYGYFRPAAVMDLRSAANADGALVAWAHHDVNAGSPAIGCPYEIPNQRLDFTPADSPLRQGAYRALAATANNVARESHVDEWAHRLGVDPLDFRLRHLRDERLATVAANAIFAATGKRLRALPLVPDGVVR